MVLSHDAAVFSHVTPPSWRARMAPRWNMETIPRRIIPMLRDGGATDEELHQMLVVNPRRLLAPALGAASSRTGPRVEAADHEGSRR
jgi:phosphotriesterase-related protein